MSGRFDEVLERRGTSSLKWDGCRQFFGTDDVLPMWVADMDFRTVPEIVQAITARAADGVFGYSLRPEAFYENVIGWFLSRYGWRAKRQWIVGTPGVVPGIAAAILAYTKPGDGVLIQTPVYYPFRESILGLGRRVVENPLVFDGRRYAMDEADLKAGLQQSSLAILCSPHNPVGRVWTSRELEVFGDACLASDTVIVSDEIHADIVYPGSRHVPIASLSKDLRGSTVSLYAASKTFNLAGLQAAFAVISSDSLRLRFNATLRSLGFYGSNIFGAVATAAAYGKGEGWLEDLLAYLGENLDFMEEYLSTNVPGIRLVRPEGTYLAWLDCRGLGMGDEALRSFLLSEAGLALDDGPMFGTGGSGFARLNFACPRSLLRNAMSKLAAAVMAGKGRSSAGGT
jgi:cystathionine beta-lyase